MQGSLLLPMKKVYFQMVTLHFSLVMDTGITVWFSKIKHTANFTSFQRNCKKLIKE